MKCQKCNISVFNRSLVRINEKGQTGIFWCDKCIKENEPELFNNLKEEESQIEKDLKEIFYEKRYI